MQPVNSSPSVTPSQVPPPTFTPFKAPSINLKKSYSNITGYVKHHLSSIGRGIKIIGYSALEGITSLFGYKEKAADFGHRVSYLMYLDMAEDNEWEFGSSLLVPTLNMASRDLFEPSHVAERRAIFTRVSSSLAQVYSNSLNLSVNARTAAEFKRVLATSLNEIEGSLSNPSQISHEVEQGVCMAMSLDLAKQMEGVDPTSPDFERILIEKAEKFRHGGGIEVALTQVIYQKAILQKYQAALLLEQIDNLERTHIITPLQRKMIDFILLFKVYNIENINSDPRFLAPEKVEYFKKEFLRDVMEHFGEEGYSLFMQFFRRLPDGASSLEEIQGALERASRETDETLRLSADNPTHARIADEISTTARWIGSFAEMIKKKYPNLLKRPATQNRSVTSTPPSTSTGVSRASRQVLRPARPSAPQPRSPRSWTQFLEFQSSELLRNYSDIKMIAKARGLELLPTWGEIRGETLFGTRGDEEAINFLRSSPPGIYYVGLITGSGGHGTLFIKSAHHSYFFDPNYGLFRCDKPNTLPTILQRYTEPDREAYGTLGPNVSDHRIKIHRVTQAPS